MKYPKLRDQRTKDLLNVQSYLYGEMEACDSGLAPEQRNTFHALALHIDVEIRIRQPSRKPFVAPGQAKGER